MPSADALARGRELFARQAWTDAYASLSDADRVEALEAVDLERLATAAHLIGRDRESEEAWTRAHQQCLEAADPPGAARCAFWLGFGLMGKGERARGGGWIARARRVLDEAAAECVEQGYLLLPVALRRAAEGDPAGAYASFSSAASVGARFRDRDLVALGRLGSGQALIHLGRVEEGVGLLDEAMAAADAGELSPLVIGTLYCAVIEACQEIFDFRRAMEWTAALSQWCEAHPDMVPYRGQCLVRRAEILQLQGAWPEALDEARRACDQLSRPPGEPAAGLAFYQRGELHRLRGELASAEEAYRQASARGRTPQPGWAQLRLAQGRLDDARAAIVRVVDEARDRLARARVLPAFVEIMLAVGDVGEARAAADELATIAAGLQAPLLRAVACTAGALVRLHDGRAREALQELRYARTTWEELGARHEAARTRVLIGLACRALGDRDEAEMEIEAGRGALQQLGAAYDLARLDALSGGPASAPFRALTPRERQVLRLVAAGRTNKSIARELRLSEKTVDRHVSNIFTKLDVPSRAAATACAYRHNLI